MVKYACLTHVDNTFFTFPKSFFTGFLFTNYVSIFIQYEIAECLEETVKIHGEAGEGLSFAAGLIYQLSTLQAVVRNIER